MQNPAILNKFDIIWPLTVTSKGELEFKLIKNIDFYILTAIFLKLLNLPR